MRITYLKPTNMEYVNFQMAKKYYNAEKLRHITSMSAFNHLSFVPSISKQIKQTKLYTIVAHLFFIVFLCLFFLNVANRYRLYLLKKLMENLLDNLLVNLLDNLLDNLLNNLLDNLLDNLLKNLLYNLLENRLDSML